jgi:hypothetical protein
MADQTVIKPKAKARKKVNKKVNKKDSWSIWSIVGIVAGCVAAAGAGAYYLLAGEETATPSKTRKASDAI